MGDNLIKVFGDDKEALRIPKKRKIEKKIKFK